MSIVNTDSQQSMSNFPKLSVLRYGLDGCSTLTADEQLARLFGIYLAMLDPLVIQSMATDMRHKKSESGPPVPTNAMGLDSAVSWFTMIEETMIYSSWLYAEEHTVPSVTDKNEDSSTSLRAMTSSLKNESRTMTAVRKYLQRYKDTVNRSKGNELKLVKFHQQLHNVRQIKKYGSLLNIDGGRCESVAIEN